MSAAVPGRVAWAVAALAPRRGESVLEIGCGGGHALLAVAAASGDGPVLGIDRSPAAVARALRRVADAGLSARVAVRRAELAHLDAGPHDAVLAINVNAFWTGGADEALAAAARLLAPGGRLGLFWEAPSPEVRDRIAARVAEGLDRAGLRGAPVPGAASTRWGTLARHG